MPVFFLGGELVAKRIYYFTEFLLSLGSVSGMCKTTRLKPWASMPSFLRRFQSDEMNKMSHIYFSNLSAINLEWEEHAIVNSFHDLFPEEVFSLGMKGICSVSIWKFNSCLNNRFKMIRYFVLVVIFLAHLLTYVFYIYWCFFAYLSK